MPIDLSLAWWEWLLCGVGGGIVSRIGFRITRITSNGARALAWWFASIVVGLVGLVAFIVGIVRLAEKA